MSTKIGNIFLRFKKDGEKESKVHFACRYEVPEAMQEKIGDEGIVDLIKKAVEESKRKLKEVNLPYSAETCAKLLYIDMPLVFWDVMFQQELVEVLCDHLYFIDVEADGYDRAFTLRGFNVVALEGKKTRTLWTNLYLLPDACQRLAEEFDQVVEETVL